MILSSVGFMRGARAETLSPPEAAPEPVYEERHDWLRPQISAQSYLVYDMQTRQILAFKNPGQKRAPASLVKLLTALVTLEQLELDQEITVSELATTALPAKLKLKNMVEGVQKVRKNV